MANVANTASSLDLLRCFEDGAVGGCGVDVRQSGGRCVVRMAGDAGEGVMRFFEVLPGVRLSFNDFHMEECESGFAVSDEVLCVDYCFEGRMEQLLSDGTCSYVAAGDLKVDDRTRHVGRFVMPLAHYHGITVSFEVKRAQRSIERALGGFPVDLRALRRRFCASGDPAIMRGVSGAERIFSDLCAAPSEVRAACFKLKVLELLLLLETTDASPALNERRPYFHRSQVEKVKAARDSMVADLSAGFSARETAERVGLPLTAFKACFKGVYGMPPFAYLRARRMERAAQLLRDTGLRVADIGLMVGYDSPSKFTAAFKDVIGQTPTAYRRACEAR